ncbi:Arm DNA-binding domain-containing protein [Azotobacter chroococcum]|uniref:Arm DNA-binding domain-containing protein n=1 Tax=Azotobacter chroococcum TaxID=353 RepID=UPI00201E3FCD|nr:DUF3596 domain-containing protein [Azotobacter chroococcum]
MARKPVALPAGLEVRGDTIRIRFVWNGKRCSETLSYPPTKSGIAAASRLRAYPQIVLMMDNRRFFMLGALPSWAQNPGK